MKRAGILTFSAADSFGALMQCYALRKAMGHQGYDVKVIHYWPKYLRKDYRVMFDRDELLAGIRNGWRCLWRSVIYIRFRNLPKAIWKQWKMNRFRRNYLNLTKKCRTEKDIRELPLLDLYVVGSDQIWNPELTGGHLDPVFFLDFLPEGVKKVSYAASTGDVPTKELAQEMGGYLKDFEHISLREAQSAEQLRKTVGLEVLTEKDPTLLLEKEKWEALLGEAPKERYIFFFSLSFKPEQFVYVNEMSEMLDLPVKHYFYGRLARRLTRDGGTCFWDDPRELLTRIKYADYIVTDSFHVTVFSIIFQKEFATFPSGKWSNRMQELLREYHMENRYMDGKEV